MTIRSLIITVLLLLTIRFAAAQEVKKEGDLSSFLEQLVSLGFDEYTISSISEEITDLTVNPVKINSQSREEIERLFFLSPFQVQSIINYCKSNGDIISEYEIACIIGFDKDLASLMANYISLEANTASGLYKSSYGQILSSLAYSSRDSLNYPGSGIKIMNRFNYQSGRYHLRLIYEKDKGETFVYDGFKPEFISGGLEITGKGKIKKIIIGDFRARFGQGLCMWQGYAAGNSPLNTNPIKGASRIVAYSSSDENNFFRGVAATAGKGPVNMILYLSANRIDANTSFDSDSGAVVKSLYDSGIHNSETRSKKRNMLGEYSAGINASFNYKNFNIGSSACWSHFDIPFMPDNNTENLHDFRGKNNIVFALDHALTLNSLYLYGESALNINGSFASLQGIRLIPAERVKLNFRWSYTSPGYISFHGQSGGSETLNNFRNNLMANISLELSPTLNLSAGILKDNQLWFGYRSASFPRDMRYLAEIIYKPMESCVVKVSGWKKQHNSDLSVETGIEQSQSLGNNSARVHLELYPFQALRLNTRFEINSDPSEHKHGLLAYQGIRYKPADSQVSISLRLYAFSAPSFNTRIYAYEEDLLYSLSIPSFYGNGSRTYLLMNYRIGNNYKFRLKTGYSDYRRNDIDYSFFEIRLQAQIRF